MPQPPAPDAAELLAACQYHLRAGTRDVEVFCEMGPLLRSIGREQEARRCFKRVVELLKDAVRKGDADRALHCETGAYIHFVRPFETEEHYYRCFSEWRDDLARLGKTWRVPFEAGRRDPAKMAFVLTTGYRLGHTEVMLRYLRAARGDDRNGLVPRVYVLEGCSEEFVRMCRDSDVALFALENERPDLRTAGLATKLRALRDRLAEDGVGCAVWVSIPAGASFALSMGLAPVQVFWALRFHPLSAPYIDGYITYGSPGEKTRTFGKQVWTVVPTPLAIDTPSVDPAQRAEVRSQFPEKILFGTVARPDKIRSPGFMECVARILEAVPNAGYVWTGAEREPEIQSFFEKRGVASRCHFAGWVDAPVYASAFDVFLETFPLGCGVTGYQALALGTPMLSYLNENTVFGMQYWPEIRERAGDPALDLSGYPLLCARSPDEYVELARRLAADAEFRRRSAERGSEFFMREVTLGTSQATAFFRAIADIVAAKSPKAAV